MAPAGAYWHQLSPPRRIRVNCRACYAPRRQNRPNGDSATDACLDCRHEQDGAPPPPRIAPDNREERCAPNDAGLCESAGPASGGFMNLLTRRYPARRLPRFLIAALVLAGLVVPSLALPAVHDPGAWKLERIGSRGLSAVWGTSPDTVFAVGSQGTVLRYDGVQWYPMDSGVHESLSDVWGASGTDVFAVGNKGTIIHYDGTGWRTAVKATSSYLRAIWGAATNDVWAVGALGAMLHFDGATWKAVASGTGATLWDMCGISATDIYAAGYDGTVLHFDGTAWTALPKSSLANLTGIWKGGSDASVVAVGRPRMTNDGVIVGSVRGVWGPMTDAPLPSLSGVWGDDGREVFAVGSRGAIFHFDGSNWSQMSHASGDGLSGVWGSSRRDVFAVGDNGTVLHFDGSTWSRMRTPIAQDGLIALGGTPQGDVFAVGSEGEIVRRDSTGWHAMDSPTRETLNAVWGSSSQDVYAVGLEGTILHFDGASWRSVVSGTRQSLGGVWGSSASDVFVVGSMCTVRHFDGSRWSDSPTEGSSWSGGLGVDDFTEIWGASPRSVFAVGVVGPSRRGVITHFDGTSWRNQGGTWGDSPNAAAVWGNSATEVYATGLGEAMLRYDGSSWHALPVHSPVVSVWSSPRTGPIAVGGSTILRLTAGTWTTVTLPGRPDLISVWGGADGRLVFVAAIDGSIYSCEP